MQPITAGIVSAAFAATLGGVAVDITSTAPLEPTSDAAGYVWPTNKVYPNQPIKMADGTTWKIKIIKTNDAGVTTVEVRPNLNQSRNSKVSVQAADVETPIWWSTLPYTPDPVEGGTEPGESVPPGPGEGIPTPPPPVFPSEPPAPDPGDTSGGN